MEITVIADVIITPCRSITELTGLTEDGRAFLHESLSAEPWQWNGESIAVDSRFASDIIEGMKEAGLTAVELC